MPSYQHVLQEWCGLDADRRSLYPRLIKWLTEAGRTEQRTVLLYLSRSDNYFQLRSVLASVDPLLASVSIMDLPEVMAIRSLWDTFPKPLEIAPHLLPTLQFCFDATREMQDLLLDLHEISSVGSDDPLIVRVPELLRRLNSEKPSPALLVELNYSATQMVRRALYRSRTEGIGCSYLLAATLSVFCQQNSMHPLLALCTPLSGIMKGLFDAPI